MRAEIERLAGRSLNEADFARMIDFVQSSANRLEKTARERKDLWSTARSAASLFAELRGLPADSDLGELVRLADAPAVRRFETALRTVFPARSVRVPSPRRIFADLERMKEGRFWWTGEPTVRDLALLSLLAGNYPEKDTDGGGTVAQVIRSEMQAIREARRRARRQR